MRILVESEKKRLEALQNSEVMLLTLGTALVWETVDGGQVVANCHRLPSSLFRRRRLTVDETVHTLLPLIHHWLDLRESRQVVLTVSPVRYLRDGLVENSRGKSVLLLACEILEQSHPRTTYFPSYEIFLDQLRDYRFYADDLVQPSSMGVHIVWECFRHTFFDDETLLVLDKVEKIQALAGHRLTPRSDPRKLGAKGLSLLDDLENRGVPLASAELRRKFAHWVAGANS